METSQQINLGKVVLCILDLLIVRYFIMPYKIYKNAVITLSNTDHAQSEERVLSSDFPIYTWFLNIYSALIVLSYPLGMLGVVFITIGSINIDSTPLHSLGLLGIIIIYFVPLWLGLLKEFID